MGLLDTGEVDPRSAGLLAAAFGMLNASGPSPFPVSTGQVIGRGGMSGLGAYQEAAKLKMMDDYRKAQEALLKQQAAREQRKMDIGLGLLSRGNRPSATPTSMGTGLTGGGMGLRTRQDLYSPEQVLGGSLLGLPGDLMLKLNERENPHLQFHNGFGLDPRTGDVVSSAPQTNQQGFSTITRPDGAGGFRVDVTPGSTEAYRKQQEVNTEFGAPQTIRVPVPGKPGQYRDVTGTPLQIKRTLEGGGAMGPTTGEQIKAEAEKVGAVESAKNYQDIFRGLNNATFTNPSKIAKYQQIGRLLDNYEGGKLSDAGFELARIGNSVGLKIDPNLSNKEAAQAMSREIALELRNPNTGAGMPGALSDSDRNYLSSLTPQIGQTAEGRKKLIEARVAIWRRELEVAQFARNYRKKAGHDIDDDFASQLQAWSNDNPLFGK